MTTRQALSRLLGIFGISLVIVCINTNATTIVVARTANEIVIGADSKVTDTYGKELTSHVCKIQQVGNLFIAFEGLLRDKATGFNVPNIAGRALRLKPDATAAEKVNILTGFLTAELFVELNRARHDSADEFHTKLEGQTFLRIVIAGFDGSHPVLFVRQFRTSFIARGIGVTVIPDDCLDDCQGEVVTRFLGETEAIEGLPEDNPDFWKDGLATGVRRLVETEIKARSEYVGPPIDLLRINAHGAKWIQKKQECADLKPFGKRVNSPVRRRGALKLQGKPPLLSVETLGGNREARKGAAWLPKIMAVQHQVHFALGALETSLFFYRNSERFPT